MRITDEQGQYQGWYQPGNNVFTQTASLVTFESIKINKDVVDTLKLQGCKFIETSVEHSGGHIEPFYLTIDRFIEMSKVEGNEYVYRIPVDEDFEVIDERREMRETLQP